MLKSRSIGVRNSSVFGGAPWNVTYGEGLMCARHPPTALCFSHSLAFHTLSTLLEVPGAVCSELEPLWTVYGPTDLRRLWLAQNVASG